MPITALRPVRIDGDSGAFDLVDQLTDQHGGSDRQEFMADLRRLIIGQADCPLGKRDRARLVQLTGQHRRSEHGQAMVNVVCESEGGIRAAP
jgi:hypothetical protein